MPLQRHIQAHELDGPTTSRLVPLSLPRAVSVEILLYEDEGKSRRRRRHVRWDAFHSVFLYVFCAFIFVAIAIVVVTFFINYYCYCWQALQILPSRLPKWLANSLWQALNATATCAHAQAHCCCLYTITLTFWRSHWVQSFQLILFMLHFMYARWRQQRPQRKRRRRRQRSLTERFVWSTSMRPSAYAFFSSFLYCFTFFVSHPLYFNKCAYNFMCMPVCKYWYLEQ